MKLFMNKKSPFLKSHLQRDGNDFMQKIELISAFHCQIDLVKQNDKTVFEVFYDAVKNKESYRKQTAVVFYY